MIKKADTPCYKCPDRNVDCHAQCEKYLAFRKSLDETNEMIKKKRDLTEAVNDLNIASYRKGMRDFKKKYRKKG